MALGPENPNEYRDDEFSRASIALDSAIGGLWEAGASLDNIEELVTSGLENAGLSGADVTITAEEVH